MPPGSCDQAARIRSPQRNSCPVAPTCEFVYDLEGRCHTAVRGDRSVAKALDATSLPIRDAIGISAGTSEILRQRRRNPFHVCVGEWKFSPIKIVSPEPSLLALPTVISFILSAGAARQNVREEIRGPYFAPPQLWAQAQSGDRLHRQDEISLRGCERPWLRILRSGSTCPQCHAL